MSHHPVCFLELTDFSLRVATCRDRQRPLRIEQIAEVPLSDPAKLATLVPREAELVCALRPKNRLVHLAQGDEAARFPGLSGLQQYAQQPGAASAESAWFAGVQAADGRVPSNTPWLMSLSSESAQQQSRALFAPLAPKSMRCVDATLSTAGALSAAVSSPTLLLEIGEMASHAFLVSNRGVLRTLALGFNLDRIAEAVQAELQLKFRGSAAKLFFNPDCDFSDNAASITARLLPALQTELAPLLSGSPAPTALCCTGLPAAQHWLAVHLAKALNLPVFTAPPKAWNKNNSVTFATPALEASVSPAWFNFLSFINAQSAASSDTAWQAEWMAVNAPLAVTTTPVDAKLPQVTTTLVSTPVSAPPPQKNPAPVRPPQPAPAQVITPPPPVTPSARPTPPAAQPAPAPISRAEPATAKSKTPLLIGGLATLVALLCAAYFYQQSREGQLQAARLAEEKAATELRLKAEAEKAQLAEKKSREESASRQRFEFETSKKLADAEAARQQAENEARQQTAARLASARGNLVIVTEPAGATVLVGDQPPATSPATLNYLKIGRYPVTIRHPRYDDLSLEVEITENGTTQPGVLRLTRIAGALTLNSDPSGSHYELRAANAPAFSLNTGMSGTTPARLTDLEPGEYVVTFTHDGWAPHQETVTVARDQTAEATWTAPNGVIQIRSNPAGATVTQNGIKVGVTPLTLNQPPGAVRYDLTLNGFEQPVALSGQVKGGETLTLNAQFPLADRIYSGNDLDENPVPIKPQLPEIPPELAQKSGRVEIQLIVNRDGTTRNRQVTAAISPELGKLYLAAIAKWKFKPGMKDGQPVHARVKIPFIITAAPPPPPEE